MPSAHDNTCMHACREDFNEHFSLTILSDCLKGSLQDVVVDDDVQEADAVDIPQAIQWR